jgi:hypothetical protein
MHVNETKVNPNTFAKYLNRDAGYTVGMFGKHVEVVILDDYAQLLHM